MCLLGIRGVALGSKGIRINCESVEKLLRCDDDRENKYAVVEVGEIDDLCENSVSTPEVAVICLGRVESEERDYERGV